MKGDETWVHNYEFETKRASMKWCYPSSPRAKKFKSLGSAGKVMATVFWDVEKSYWWILCPEKPPLTQMLIWRSMQPKRMKRVQPNLEMSKRLLQHHNAKPHTSLKTREMITSIGWTIITHSLYSRNLAPCDFHLFEPLKEIIRGQQFTTDEQVKHNIKNMVKITAY